LSTITQMPTATKYATKCRQKDCQWEIFASPLEFTADGQATQKTMKFIQALSQHIASAHPQQFAAFMGTFQESFGLLTLMHFLIEDPTLHRRFNFTRAGYFRMTQVARISDLDIQEKAGRLWDLPEDERPAALVAMLQDMRDVLTERGKYSILDNPVSGIVQP